MSLSSENIVVLYHNGNSDSLTFAQAYQALHNLDDSQLIGLNCSGNEILASYSDFQAEIEIDLAPQITDDIQAILIGYGVPGGFMDGSDIISTASRLACIGKSYSKKTPNPLFNRQLYQEYGSEDASNALIVSRIDAPSLEVALNLLNNTSNVIRQGIVNGSFFFDKYAVLESDADSLYENALIDFEESLLPLLNVPIIETVFWDEYTDVVVPKLINDSFMWAWKADRAGYTFFENTNTSRVFLYNADVDGAADMRNAEDRRFPMLAISSGYVTTAGSMSDPTPQGFLIPQPFFDALYRGATLGEAYIYSVPYLNWTVTMFGDPLVKISFPAATPINDNLSINTGWDIMADQLSSAIAYGYRSNDQLQQIVSILTTYTDVTTKVGLFIPFNNLATLNNSNWISQYGATATKLISYVLQNTSGQTTPFTNYLVNRGVEVSDFLVLASNILLADSLILPQGQWKAETIIQNYTPEYAIYNFEMIVASDSAFTDILYSLGTEGDQSNWSYEQNVGEFVAFPSTGVSSSFQGRRVQYISPEIQYMDRGNVFYYKIREKDQLGNLNPYIIQQGIVAT